MQLKLKFVQFKLIYKTCTNKYKLRTFGVRMVENVKQWKIKLHGRAFVRTNLMDGFVKILQRILAQELTVV